MTKLPFPERVLHQHTATLGKTGSGKSSALRDIVEYLLDRNKRVCVVDPKGDWWGLKSSADGKSAGYPVIMFGDFKEPRATDVPINDRSGKHVAELIATGNRPAVLGFRGWMPAQLVRFWLDFAPALFNANEGELYVIIDEVHNFAPKGKIFDPDAGKCLHWTNRIMSEGRGLGLTFFIASQRPQKVHNDTLDNCETLIAMRVTHPRSREAAEEWINAKGDKTLAKEVLGTLAELKRGEAWVWSPENDFGPKRVQFPMFSTFDSFAPPQLQKKVSQAGWSEVDLDQVKTKLAAVIAEAKANDPKELKAEITRLKQDLAKKPAPVATLTATDRKIAAQAAKASVATLTEQQKVIEQMRTEVEAAMKVIAKVTAFGFEQTKVNPKQLEHAVEKAVEELGRSIAAASDIRRKEFDQLKREAEAILKRLERIIDKKIEISVDVVRAQPPFVLGAVPPPHHAPRVVSIPSRSKPAAVAVNGDQQISATQIRVLSRLVELMQCSGQMMVRKEQLAAWAEYSPTSSTWGNYLGGLRSAGMIDYPAPGFVSITDAGRAIAQPEHPPTTSGEMLRRAKQVLGGGESKLLEILHSSREAISKTDLAEASDYSATSSTFGNYLGHMRSIGFVEYPSPGRVKAADWLYLDSEESARA